MIVLARCPYRISLLGGGSDIDWYLRKRGSGLALGFSLNECSYVAARLNISDSNKFIINYSSREEVLSVDDISHPLVKAAFRELDFSAPIEMSSFGSYGSGGGLGGSSSFLVALIHCIKALQGKKVTNSEAARIACKIEIDELSFPIGRQDQYLSALGGVNYLEFDSDGGVIQKNLGTRLKAIQAFCNELFIVNTGVTRSANKILARAADNKTSSISCIDGIKDIAEWFIRESQHKSEADVQRLLLEGILLSWQKKKLIPGVMTAPLLQLENELVSADIQVLKLLGAGGGGYFLCRYKGADQGSLSSMIEKLGRRLISCRVNKHGCRSWIK